MKTQTDVMTWVVGDSPHAETLSEVLTATNKAELLARHEEAAAIYDKSEYEVICLWILAAEEQDVRAFRYSEIADMYEEMETDIGMMYGVEKATEYVPQYVSKDAKILDIAAGTGSVGKFLAQHGYSNLEALDISPGMLEEARKKNVYSALHQKAIGESWDFPTASYDAVTCMNVLPDPTVVATDDAFTEAIRVTKPGGHIIFTLIEGAAKRRGYLDMLANLEAAGKLKREVVGDAIPAAANFGKPLTTRAYVYQVL